MLGFALLLLCKIVIISCLSPQNGLQAVIKPPRVSANDIVGFISPASPPYYIYNASTYQEHVVNSMKETLQLQTVFGKHAFDTYGYLAGKDQDRAADIMTMFQDSNVKFIIANRGGWGCNRLLQLLDFSVISKNPKPIMGYSDLTGLLNAIHTKTGMVTFHGPMGIDTWVNTRNPTYTNDVIFKGNAEVFVNPAPYNYTTIRGGKARGKMIGGNLSVFADLVGTEYLPNDFSDYILFLEEVGEEPYRIDRYLTQLELSGILNQIKGFVWGICTSCDASNPSQSLTFMQVLKEKILPLNIPAYYGARIGHDLDYQFTIAIGVNVEIDANVGTITMLESAVL